MTLSITIAISLVVICIVVQNLIIFLSMKEVLKESQRLLASRGFTDFAVGEARIAKATTEQKPAESYDSAWSEEGEYGKEQG